MSHSIAEISGYLVLKAREERKIRVDSVESSHRDNVREHYESRKPMTSADVEDIVVAFIKALEAAGPETPEDADDDDLTSTGAASSWEASSQTEQCATRESMIQRDESLTQKEESLAVRAIKNVVWFVKNTGCEVYDVATYIENRDYVSTCMEYVKPLLDLYCRVKGWMFKVSVRLDHSRKGGMFVTETLTHANTHEAVTGYCDWRDKHDSGTRDRLRDFINNYDSFATYRETEFATYDRLPDTLAALGFEVDRRDWDWSHLLPARCSLTVTRDRVSFFVIYVANTLYCSMTQDIQTGWTSPRMHKERKWYVKSGYVEHENYFGPDNRKTVVVHEKETKGVAQAVIRFALLAADEFGACDGDRLVNSSHIKPLFLAFEREMLAMETAGGLDSLLCRSLAFNQERDWIDPNKGFHVNHNVTVNLHRFGHVGGVASTTGLPFVTVVGHVVFEGGVAYAHCLVILNSSEDSKSYSTQPRDMDAHKHVEDMIHEAKVNLIDASKLNHPIVEYKTSAAVGKLDMMGILDEFATEGKSVLECTQQLIAYMRTICVQFIPA